MVTKNFMMLVAAILQSNGTSSTPGNLPVVDVNGNTYYVGHRFGNYSFPVTLGKTVNKDNNSAGIRIGSGNTPPTKNDYNLEAPISSGFTVNTPSYTWGVDINDNPYVDIAFTVTNTTDSDINIREISYVQPISKSNTKGGNVSTSSSGNAIIMLDRTVLDTPVTVPANGSASITYRLKTILPT